MAPKGTAYTQWSCHSGMANTVHIVPTPLAPSNRSQITVFWASQSCRPAGRLVLLLIKAGDVETNPGPTNIRKQVWICDICHRKIQVRKQISIRCIRIEHWVNLTCTTPIHALTATTPLPDPTPTAYTHATQTTVHTRTHRNHISPGPHTHSIHTCSTNNSTCITVTATTARTT